MKITYPLPPNLPEQLPLLTNCQLEDEAILENHLYQQIDLPNQEIRNLVFRDAVFDHLSLANGQFASFDCSNVRFEACDFSNVEWLSGSFHRVTFLRCNLTGTNFADSYLKIVYLKIAKPIMLLFVLQILILFTLIRHV